MMGLWVCHMCYLPYLSFKRFKQKYDVINQVICVHMLRFTSGTKKQQVCLPSLPLRTSPGDTGRSFLSALISSRMRSCSVGGACACGFSLRADTCHRRGTIRFMACSAVCQLPAPHFPLRLCVSSGRAWSCLLKLQTPSSTARFTPEIWWLPHSSFWFTELRKLYLQRGTFEPCERRTIFNNVQQGCKIMVARIRFRHTLLSSMFF